MMPNNVFLYGVIHCDRREFSLFSQYPYCHYLKN
nr:MAG TPA: hypothetical protein [Caudoviricetes sp.]